MSKWFISITTTIVIIVIAINIIIICYYIVIFIKGKTPDDTWTKKPLPYPTRLYLRTTSLARCQP